MAITKLVAFRCPDDIDRALTELPGTKTDFILRSIRETLQREKHEVQANQKPATVSNLAERTVTGLVQ